MTDKLRELTLLALDSHGCERLKDFYECGPVQRAAVETFLEAALSQQDAQAVPQGWRVERVSDDDVRVYGPDAETWLLRANPGKGTFEDFAHRFCFALASCPQPEAAPAVAQQDAQAINHIPDAREMVSPTYGSEEIRKLRETIQSMARIIHALEAAPTPPAQRVMLTPEEIQAIWTDLVRHVPPVDQPTQVFASAIIEAYERKNGISQPGYTAPDMASQGASQFRAGHDAAQSEIAELEQENRLLRARNDRLQKEIEQKGER